MRICSNWCRVADSFTPLVVGKYSSISKTHYNLFCSVSLPSFSRPHQQRRTITRGILRFTRYTDVYKKNDTHVHWRLTLTVCGFFPRCCCLFISIVYFMPTSQTSKENTHHLPSCGSNFVHKLCILFALRPDEREPAHEHRTARIETNTACCVFAPLCGAPTKPTNRRTTTATTHNDVFRPYVAKQNKSNLGIRFTCAHFRVAVFVRCSRRCLHCAREIANVFFGVRASFCVYGTCLSNPAATVVSAMT